MIDFDYETSSKKLSNGIVNLVNHANPLSGIFYAHQSLRDVNFMVVLLGMQPQTFGP